MPDMSEPLAYEVLATGFEATDFLATLRSSQHFV